MSKRAKYLSLLSMLAFLAGQVQYSYTTYFCRMLDAYVPAQTMALSVQAGHADDACVECDPLVAADSGHQIMVPNCFQINTLQKDVVSTFVGTSTVDLHPVTAIFAVLPPPVVQQAGMLHSFIFRTALSPPLDLPTLNSTLLI